MGPESLSWTDLLVFYWQNICEIMMLCGARQQAIIWTNVDQVLRRNVTSLGHTECKGMNE